MRGAPCAQLAFRSILQSPDMHDLALLLYRGARQDDHAWWEEKAGAAKDIR